MSRRKIRAIFRRTPGSKIVCDPTIRLPLFRDGKVLAILRPLDESDPRNPEHPAHREKWLEIFGAFGRAIADRDWYQDNPEYQRPTDYPFRNAFERLKQPPSGNAQ